MPTTKADLVGFYAPIIAGNLCAVPPSLVDVARVESMIAKIAVDLAEELVNELEQRGHLPNVKE